MVVITPQASSHHNTHHISLGDRAEHTCPEPRTPSIPGANIKLYVNCKLQIRRIAVKPKTAYNYVTIY